MRGRRHRKRNERATNWRSLTVSRSKYAEKRTLEDRRKTTVQGVTGYDRRKRNRRASRDDMEKRILQDRRTTTVQGVTWYDRRKRNRRASRDDAEASAPVAPKEHAEPQADDLDFTIPKRKG